MRVVSLIIISVLLLSNCTTIEKIKDGQTAYERKQYAKAISLLSAEYNGNKNKETKAKKAFLLGQSYQKVNQNKASISWYLRAFNDGYGPEALLNYGRALKQDEQYEQAIVAFESLGSEYKHTDLANDEIAFCRQALMDKSNHIKSYKILNMDFNSPKADYGPHFYQNDQLVITSDRLNSSGDDIYQWTGNKYSDLYLVNPSYEGANLLSKKINTSNNEGTACFNSDFTIMYFTRCHSPNTDKDYCKIYVSRKENQVWTEPQMLPFQVPENNYYHPTLYSDDSTLIFSSDLQADLGGFDLYSVRLSAEGWSAPHRLSDVINTAWDEQFPHLYKDTLYYASNRMSSYGGLDIFHNYLDPEGQWSSTTHLPWPINSGADDFAFIISEKKVGNNDLVYGYFSSSRAGGKGYDDIYYFEESTSSPAIVTEEKAEDKVYKKLKVQIIVKEQLYINPGDPNSGMAGTRSIESEELWLNTGDSPHLFEPDPQGNFIFDAEYNHSYTLTAANEGYYTKSKSFRTNTSIPEGTGYKTLIYELILEPIIRNTEINLDNIYYDYDKWNIRSDATSTLDELAQLLTENEQISIQLSSHTDCRGEDEYNQELSYKRAQSVVDYLIDKGISQDRLTAVGYGEFRPKIKCECEHCSEEEHQVNRRTTFIVLD